MSAPFGPQPTYDELVRQIADLRDAVAKPLTLDALPLADLRKQLIDNGEPLDLSVLAIAGTLGSLKYAAGTDAVSFTASATSATRTLAHGLERVPAKVFAFARAPRNEFVVLYEAVAPDSTSIAIAGRQVDNVAVTVTQNFYWLAIG